MIAVILDSENDGLAVDKAQQVYEQFGSVPFIAARCEELKPDVHKDERFHVLHLRGDWQTDAEWIAAALGKTFQLAHALGEEWLYIQMAEDTVPPEFAGLNLAMFRMQGKRCIAVGPELRFPIICTASFLNHTYPTVVQVLRSKAASVQDYCRYWQQNAVDCKLMGESNDGRSESSLFEARNSVQ